ncbi:ankyrin repeat-containing domain protein [Xylaria longipes]|nr:ankyrin repeat-containing domain protein [Xylaria longipes]
MKEVGQSLSFSRGKLMSTFPFLHYAIEAWAEHERESRERIVSQEDLLDYFAWPSEKLVQLWVQLHLEIVGYRSFLCQGTRMVHITSYYGFIGSLQVIIKGLDPESNIDIDLKDSWGRTPLLYAAWGGHRAVVELLLSTGKVAVDLTDNWGQTPLSLAAQEGYQDIVQLLQEHQATVATNPD